MLDHHGQPWRDGPLNTNNHILIVAVDLFLTMKLLAEAVLKVPALIRLRHAKQKLKNVRARQENENTTPRIEYNQNHKLPGSHCSYEALG